MVSKAFVLAGGLATRLAETGLTVEKPKTLLEVGDRTVLEWNIQNLKEHGVKEIVLGVGHLSEKIEEFLDSQDFGIEFIYSKEEEPLGTAGALKLAEKFFSENEDFFMCNGDEAKQIDYSKVLEVHERNNAIATIALKEMKNIAGFGVVRLEGERILEFVEKPSEGEKISNLINAGAYVLSPKVFEFIPENVAVSIEKEVFPKIAVEEKLFGCRTSGKWFAIDTPEKYERAVEEHK